MLIDKKYENRLRYANSINCYLVDISIEIFLETISFLGALQITRKHKNIQLVKKKKGKNRQFKNLILTILQNQLSISFDD